MIHFMLYTATGGRNLFLIMQFETFSYFSCDFVSKAVWLRATWKSKLALRFPFELPS